MLVATLTALSYAELGSRLPIGFEAIVNVAEEVKNPEQNVPKAILLALGIVGVIYILVSWLATQVLSPAALSASGAPLLAVVQQAQPAFPPVVFIKVRFREKP